MEISFFLAQLFGLTLIIFSAVAFFQLSLISATIRDMKPSSFPLFMAGFIGVFGGLAIILSHNIWEMNWRVIITIFGWVTLIKGIAYVAFPEAIMRIGVSLFEGKWRKWLIVTTLLVGCWLTYHGFGFGAL